MQEPDLQPGDKVCMDYCPEYFGACHPHNAKVKGDSKLRDGVWYVPVSFRCISRRSANVSCHKLIKLRSSMKFSKPAIVTGVVLVTLLLIGMWFVGNYNSLVGANEDVNNSWAKVETQYQRRFDLIGNLVESVKGSQVQEQKVFGQIADARKQYQNATTQEEKAQAASSIETNVAMIPRLQEAYPELKSNANVQALMGELSGTEGQISTVRDKYNDTVTNYNKNVQSFPKNMFAGMFNFEKRTQFKAASGAETAPQVKF